MSKKNSHSTTDGNIDTDFIEDEEIKTEEYSQDKIKKIRQEKDEAIKAKRQCLEDLQKAKADFVNMRKRDEQDKERFIKSANEKLVSEIIPLLDSFDLALHESFWTDKPEIKKGVDQIHNRFKQILENHGVQIHNPLGEIFDPNKQEAISMEETKKEDEDHKISEVIQKGYELNGKIIRSAKVKIKTFIK